MLGRLLRPQHHEERGATPRAIHVAQGSRQGAHRLPAVHQGIHVLRGRFVEDSQAYDLITLIILIVIIVIIVIILIVG